MALWSKTGALESKPKWIASADLPFTFFVDEAEAQKKASKDKGINGAGWWDIREHKDSQGNARYKSVLLVAVSSSDVVVPEVVSEVVETKSSKEKSRLSSK